jgi:uncharacterized protein YceK
MKKIVLALAIAVLGLSGCATDSFVKKEVVIQYEYVIRKATDQQKALPDYPPVLDVETADQLGLAQWIADNEKRQLDLESIIKRLIEYYEQAPSAAEKAAATPAAAPSTGK